MLITYKFKLKPNRRQKQILAEWLDTCRFVYNCALETKILTYQSTGRSVSTFALIKELPLIKQTEELKWIGNVNAGTLQAVLRQLDRAFSEFLTSSKGFPRFASKRRYKALFFPQRVYVKHDTVKIPKIGFIKFFKSRLTPPNKKLKKTVVFQRIDGWYISLFFETTPTQSLAFNNKLNSVGIDVGITNYASLSTGDFIENKRFIDGIRKEMRILQRKLARQKKGSKNREKTKHKIRKLFLKYRNRKQDFIHKLSSQLVNDFDFISMEKLDIRNMTKSAKGTVENPGRHVKAKAGLNRSLMDLSVYDFSQKLKYKAQLNGKHFIQVKSAYTSQTCFQCGYISKKNRRSQSKFHCQNCGHQDNADVNAAKNILRKGLKEYNISEINHSVF